MPRRRDSAAASARATKSGSVAASPCREGQPRGTSSKAAMISRASVRACSTRADVSTASSWPIRAPIDTFAWAAASAGAIEALLLVSQLERLNERLDVTIEDALDIMELQSDPVVGDAIVGKIVGANLG